MIFRKGIATKVLIAIAFWLSTTWVGASSQNLEKLWHQGQYLNIINILESEVNNNQYEPEQLADIYVYLSASYAQLGRYSPARSYLSQALAIYRAKGVQLKEVAVLSDLAHVNQILGKNKLALEETELALTLIKGKEENNHLLIASKIYLIRGQAQLSANNYNSAIESYTKALELGKKLASPNIQAKAKLNLSEAHVVYQNSLVKEAGYLNLEGFTQEADKNLELAEREWESALNSAQEAKKLADGLDPLLVVQIQLQLLTLNSEMGDIEIALAQVESIPNSVKKAELLRSLAKFSDNPLEVLKEGVEVSSTIGDGRGESLALLSLSDLALSVKNYSEAMTLTKTALDKAGESLAEDVLYQGWFRSAQINQVLGNSEYALLDYRRALVSLQSLRGTQGESLLFQLDYVEEIEPIYRGYLNLLLSNPTANNLTEAVQVFELMQLSDLESFFGDRCIEEIENNPAPKEILSETNSVALYAISTESALHLLLLSPNGSLRHHVVNISQQELDQMLKQWRYNLEDYATERYLETSRSLYEKMIRPFASELASLNPSTIVFIGDRFFRNVPLDALHDGEQFLIEKYPLAITIGLQFTDFREFNKPKRALIFGLTVEKPPFGKLELAQFEANQVAALIPGAKKFLDRDFTKAKLATELERWRDLSTVHLITHSNFGGTLEKTFLQAYDSTISLTELEDLMSAANLNVNLVVLSACQTATGNSRGLLGLAGVTVRGNAQAVLGSYWFVKDQETARLMEYFYQNLYGDIIMSKAEALQQAKVELIQLSPHPLIWSGFTLIGNWI